MKFHSGRYLKVDDVEKMVQSTTYKHCVVLIAGLHNSGKTTLITSIYEYFQRGIRNYPFLFAGSQTLHEFENLCYLSRVTSGSNNQIERTPLDSDERENFLHLCIRASPASDASKNKSAYNLFLADFPGESFKNIVRSGKKLSQMRAIKIANHFLFLMNGEELISNRNKAFSDLSSIVRTTLDHIYSNKLQLYKKTYYLIISKWDLIQNLSVTQRSDIVNYVDRKLNDLKDFTKNDYKIELIIDKIAARPSKEALSIDGNLVNLIKSWTVKQ